MLELHLTPECFCKFTVIIADELCHTNEYSEHWPERKFCCVHWYFIPGKCAQNCLFVLAVQRCRPYLPCAYLSVIHHFVLIQTNSNPDKIEGLKYQLLLDGFGFPLKKQV